MGLDMMIYKMRRFGTATINDVWAVESMLSLHEYNKEHPDKQYSIKEWCGHDEPAKEFIDFYSPMWHKGKYRMCIVDEVAYWRKANAIHEWFVENVQNGEDDCEAHRELTRSDLTKLIGLCKKVLKNSDLAPELLPTQDGFFFGGTQYDDWYFKDLRTTI